MPKKEKAFITERTYIHNYYDITYLASPSLYSSSYSYFMFPYVEHRSNLKESRTNKEIFEVKPSDLNAVIANIKTVINQKNKTALLAVLESDFLIKAIRENDPYKDIHTDLPSEKQGYINVHSVTYQVRSNLEQIALAGRLGEILTNIDAEMKTVILSSFINLQFDRNEKGDFSGLDLSGACFAGAQLGCSCFTDATLTNVDFSNTNLEHCIITQEQLDSCTTYADAKINRQFSPYWTLEIRQGFMQRLQKLKDYSDDKLAADASDPLSISKKQAIDKLYQDHYSVLADSTKNISHQQKKKLFSDLKATQTACESNRNLKYLLGEFIAFIGLLIGGYFWAAKRNEKRSGISGVFKEPVTHEMTRTFAEKVESVLPSNLPSKNF